MIAINERRQHIKLHLMKLSYLNVFLKTFFDIYCDKIALSEGMFAFGHCQVLR